MKKFGNFVCKHKTLILIITVLLIIPSLIGIKATKINYDILVYLPDDIETIKGQNTLTNDFDMGAFSISIIDKMNAKDVLKLEDKIKRVNGVNEVVSLYDVVGTSIPIEFLPDEVTNHLVKKDSTLLLITFRNGTSDKNTLNAVDEIRNITKNYAVKVSGMSAMTLDTMNLSDSEVSAYVIIAVILCLVILMISLDSYAVPFLLLLNIGIAILFNMGTNVFLGEISYITKAISAVLQLGVTTDFSIFLYHKYERMKKEHSDNNEAMALAIKDTITAVTGSSLTTIAGFLALCTMTLTLGKDIGLVMAKGVLFGLVGVVTIFPSLLLYFDKIIKKTTHKVIIPSFNHVKNFVMKHYVAIFIAFIILIIPAFYGQSKTNVYYNLDRSLPSTLASSIANSSLKKDYNIVSPELILVNKNLSNDDLKSLTSDLKKVDGIDLVLSLADLSELGIPSDFNDENELTSMLQSDKHKLILLNSKYEIATNKLNKQIDTINKIVKKYDKNAVVAGEGPLMKDLVEISDTDFHNVTYASLGIIVIIMLFVLKSISLPILLIGVIEFAIFINMGIPYYTSVTIPFIASIVIGTIQLGATIDYAILMTTKFLEERKKGKDKFEAIKASLDSSVGSIFVSGLCFFGATFGVGIYSKLEMIGSLCTLISRGAIISMIVVIMVLPSVLLVFDKLIFKTTLGFKKGDVKMKKNNRKKVKATLLILMACLLVPVNALALTKDETVYAKLKNTGEVKKVTVTEHLINEEKERSITDLTNLTGIKNLNGNERFVLNNSQITWETKTGKDIFYEGKTDNNLPISVQLTYKLNGEEKKPKEMLNKKGNVEIEVKFVNNDSHVINGKTMYTPFALALTTTIKASKNQNIKVTNGKVISTGTSNVITAVSAPGLSESLAIEELKTLDTIKISYETERFSLNSIYVVITPKLLEESDLKKLDDVDKLYAKVNVLNSSSTQLVSGSKAIYDGANELNSGALELKEGTNKAYQGIMTIKNSVDNSIYALKNDNANALDEQTVSYIKQTVTEKAALTNEQKAVIADNAAQATKQSDTYKNLNNKLNTLINNGITSELVNVCSSSEIPEGYLETCQTNAAYIESFVALKQMLTLMEETARQTATTTAEQVSITTASKVSEEVANLVANQVKDAATKKTIESLNVLSSGINELSHGLKELDSGVNSLSEGTSSLTNGAKTLYEGTNKFNKDGISKISELVNKNIKPKINSVKQLKKLSENYSSFTMKNDNDKGTTKFIYLIDGIK